MYLVTGGGGFIGSHLVRRLVQLGGRVRVLDNGLVGSREALDDVLDDVEWIDGDVRDQEIVARACKRVVVVFHHAAIASVAQSVADPLETHATNVMGTLNVLMAAQRAGARRVIYASSSAVYGNLPVLPKHEDLPVQPLSPYGVQKLAAESYARVWHATYGLETVVLRYFNVFGPGQDPYSEYSGVVPRFLSAALDGTSPLIYGDGEQARDFIYVSNVVDVNMVAARSPHAAGGVFNVAMGRSVTLNELVSSIGRILGRPVHPRHKPARAGEVRISSADISRLRNVLGYEPAVSFADGLELTLRVPATARMVREPA